MNADPLIPSAVAERLLGTFGEHGHRWLAELPSVVADLTERWTIRVDPGIDHVGACSFIAPAQTADGAPAILKIGVPHDEAEHEAEALRVYDGDGAVWLLASDPALHAHLLERCDPGTTLFDHPDLLEANDIAAAVIRRLWRAPPNGHPFLTMDVDMPRRASEMREHAGDALPARIADEAASIFEALARSDGDPVLLHQDLNPGNVLQAQRMPWLAIDPKPLVGDRAFDAAQLILNRIGVEGPPLRVQIDRLAEHLGVDRERAWGWTYARAVENVGWHLADGRAADAQEGMDAVRLVSEAR